MTDLPEELESRCAVHVTVPAGGTCRRCGRFCCAGCLGAGGLCSECVPRELRGSPSALAVTAAALGVASLCLLLPALPAIALAQLELGRIARGQSSLAGRGWAVAGRLLGCVALVLGLLAFLAVAT